MIKTRIKQFCLTYGLTDRIIEKKLGLEPYEFSCLMRSTKDLPLSVIVRLLESYDYLNPTWLILGKGSMVNDDDPLELSSVSPDKIHPEILAIINNYANSLMQKTGQMKLLSEQLYKNSIKND